jgi:hypothetical protein
VAGGRIEQRLGLRAEPPLLEAAVLVRGGPDTQDKLARHARRTARAWSLDGQPLLGISVFGVLDIPPDELLSARFATYRVIRMPAAARLRDRGFELLPTGCARTTPSASAGPTASSSMSCWPRSGLRWPRFSTLGARSGERRAVMYRVDITADLNDEDETGYLWTFLDEARDPGQITPGALVVAGDEDTAAVCQVVDLAPAGDGTIVHLRLLPGLVDDYRQLVERALAS